MTQIAIGIITFKRPDSLKRLLDALAGQQFGYSPAPTFAAVVVDNDAAGSARAVCDEARARGLAVTYIVEPLQGIPLARNRVLDALPDGCEAVAWIDDDESPDANWLNALVATRSDTGADIVMGSIEAILPEGCPGWVKNGGFFNRRRFIDRATLGEGATNNCLMSVEAIRAKNLRFAEKMRFNGGTDTYFFRQAARAGLRIVWAADAVVKDYVPLERCRLGWLLQRHFRSGNTLAICDMELAGATGWVKRLGYSFSKLAQGLITLPLCIAGYHELVKSLLMISRSVGMFAGLFGVRYHEYAPNRVITATG